MFTIYTINRKYRKLGPCYVTIVCICLRHGNNIPYSSILNTDSVFPFKKSSMQTKLASHHWNTPSRIFNHHPTNSPLTRLGFFMAAEYATRILTVHHNGKLWITRTRAMIVFTLQNTGGIGKVRIGNVQGGINICNQTNTSRRCRPSTSGSNRVNNQIGRTK